MQLTRFASAAALGPVALLALAWGAEPARADGWVGVRGAYYQERSTRVAQPMLDARLDAGDAGLVEAHFLVDSITAASPAAGSIVEFTERRYEGGAGYTHTFGPLRLGARARYSVEPDYTSRFGALRGELDLFDRNTRLSLVAGRGWDDIRDRTSRPGGGRPEEHLYTGITSLGVIQLLSPVLVGALTYDFLDSYGYHENPYRRVTGGATPVEERVPDRRFRHALYGSLRGLWAKTGTVAVLGYRYYADDWGIVGHTPELRLVQPIVAGLEVRVRYRFHTQTAARFYQDTYTQEQISDPTVFVTDDPKLDALTTHLVGGQAAVDLALFGVRGALGAARVDLVVERVWQSSAFGDAWIAQLGFEVPFAY